MTEQNGETYLTCPFEPSHRIISWRMSKHIQKCKLNYPDIKMAICRFNSTHITSETEIAAHENTCPDRIKLDSFVYRPEDNSTLNKYPINTESVIQEGEETWDDDNCETYNPQEYCLKNKILRRQDGTSAGSRKNFRMEERRRFQALETKPEAPTNAQILAQRRPKTQPLCMAPLAQTIEPEKIIQKMANLNLSRPGPSTVTEEKIIKDDEFILVKNRGRGRRGVTNK